MKFRLLVATITLFVVLLMAPRVLWAKSKSSQNRDPIFEISAMGSFSKTDYGNGTYSTSRHYTGTIGYYLFPVTELEVSYAYSDTYFNSNPVQTSNNLEQSLDFCVVQSLVPPQFWFDPYLKGGVGQYNRTQTGTVNGIPTAENQTKSPSGILGGGVRIFLFKGFSLKAEGTAYVPNFNISGAINNFTVQAGIGFQF